MPSARGPHGVNFKNKMKPVVFHATQESRDAKATPGAHFKAGEN